MAVESNNSSFIWNSSNSQLQFQSSSLSSIPTYYDRSLVAPLTLTERKRNSNATNVQLPPLRLRSPLTWHSSEEDNFFMCSTTTSEHELDILKQKFNRHRASLAVRFLLFFSIKIFPFKLGYLIRGMCI
jgi:hypothetical protein